METGAASFREKKREDNMFEKENGDQQSHGVGAGAKSDGSTERQPDVVDDHPGKSRSTFYTSHSVILYVCRFFQI